MIPGWFKGAGLGRLARPRCGLLAVIVSLCFAPTVAHAQFHVEMDLQAFRWREHTDPIQVKESGPRVAFGAGYALPVTSGPLFTVFGRFYTGSVDYNGALLSSPSTPATGTTKYMGGTEGVGLRYRWPSSIDGVLGLEFDQWRRELTPDQREFYRFTSIRLGVERQPTLMSPWIAGGGLRFLVSSNEEATFTDASGVTDVTLEPGLGTNAYLQLGVRFTPHFTVLGYWDAMRLEESDPVPIGANTVVFQPKSDMDLFGVRLLYGLGQATGE
jgi:hypothetical protein